MLVSGGAQLFITAWAVVRLYSTTAAVVMTCVALVIPPWAVAQLWGQPAPGRQRSGWPHL
jgi:hypothetical protein